MHPLAGAIQERVDPEALPRGGGPGQSPRLPQPGLAQEGEDRIVGPALHARREQTEIPDGVAGAVGEVRGNRPGWSGTRPACRWYEHTRVGAHMGRRQVLWQGVTDGRRFNRGMKWKSSRPISTSVDVSTSSTFADGYTLREIHPESGLRAFAFTPPGI